MTRAEVGSPARRSLRAVVTGGAGFIGSHLVNRLIAEGWSVLVIDDLSTGRADRLPSQATLEELDIADAELAPTLVTWRPGLVFHLAAQASVPFSHRDPIRDLAVNVVGSHRVGLAAREAGAERIVFVSSGGAVYGETPRPASERTLPSPTSYYGVHKLTAEGHIALSGIPYAIARPSNVYGPRQSTGLEGAVVASFLEQAANSNSVQIHGDGRQVRDFIHVHDAIEALWRLASADAGIGIWNVSSGRSIAVTELADLVEAALGRPLERRLGPRRLGDVHRSSLTSARLRASGWRPTVTLKAGLRQLVRDSVRG